MEHKSKIGIIILFVFLVVNIFLRTYNMDNLPAVFDSYDEGVYLYSAKLINQGLTPYKDFVITHPPLFFYFFSLFFKLNFNVLDFRILNAIISSLIVVPIFLIMNKITKNLFLIFISLLFFTLSPLFFIYSRIVILEPVATLLILFGIYIYFFADKKLLKIIGSLLFVFACFIRMTSIISILALFLIELIFDKKDFFRKQKVFLISFLSIFILLLVILSFIPNFLDNVFIFQFTRSKLSWTDRFSQLLVMFKYDFLLFGLGIMGSFLIFLLKNRVLKVLSLINIITFIVIFFITRTFYAHYLLQLIPFSAIILPFLLNRIIKFKGTRALEFIIFILFILQILGIFKLASQNNSVEKNIVGKLRQDTGYLYTATPAFALSSGRVITPWYYANDSNIAYERNVSAKELENVIGKSKTILFDSRSSWQLPKEVQDYVFKNFEVRYKLGEYTIFTVKKTFGCRSCQSR